MSSLIPERTLSDFHKPAADLGFFRPYAERLTDSETWTQAENSSGQAFKTPACSSLMIFVDDENTKSAGLSP